MTRILSNLNPTNLNPKVARILIAVGALTMFVLSAGAPYGYNG